MTSHWLNWEAIVRWIYIEVYLGSDLGGPWKTHREQEELFLEGVLYLSEKKLDVFFVTLNKSEKDYSG